MDWSFQNMWQSNVAGYSSPLVIAPTASFWGGVISETGEASEFFVGGIFGGCVVEGFLTSAGAGHVESANGKKQAKNTIGMKEYKQYYYSTPTRSVSVFATT